MNKFNRNYSIIMILLMTFVLTFFSLATRAEQPLVAVLPFEEGDFGWKGFQGEEILNGITQMVTDRLVEVKGIRVIERTRIDEVLMEQDFGESGRVDPATAAVIGKILGVDALILGTLTMMDVGESGGISFGPLSVTGVKAKVVMTGRVVDANTGEIKDSFEATGESSQASISVSDIHGLSFGSNAFMSSALGKSIQQAVDVFTKNIISNPEMLISSQSILQGKVLKIIGGKLIVDIGSRAGVREKQTGELIRMVEVEGLTETVVLPIGQVQVFSVNENSAVIIILNTEEAPQEGDYVYLESLR